MRLGIVVETRVEDSSHLIHPKCLAVDIAHRIVGRRKRNRWRRECGVMFVVLSHYVISNVGKKDGRNGVLTPPTSPPHISSSLLYKLPLSLSYSLLAQGLYPIPIPRRSPPSLGSPWKPAPNCLSISFLLFSSRRSLRSRDFSQSSHRRRGMVVPLNTAVESSCPLDRISPSTRLEEMGF